MELKLQFQADQTEKLPHLRALILRFVENIHKPLETKQVPEVSGRQLCSNEKDIS